MELSDECEPQEQNTQHARARICSLKVPASLTVPPEISFAYCVAKPPLTASKIISHSLAASTLNGSTCIRQMSEVVGSWRWLGFHLFTLDSLPTGNQNISLESVDGFARHGIRSRLASYGVCLLCCPRKHQTQTQTQTANVITLDVYFFPFAKKTQKNFFFV